MCTSVVVVVAIQGAGGAACVAEAGHSGAGEVEGVGSQV